jgi:hypothetical protein
MTAIDQVRAGGGDTANLSLSRREVQVLEAQLSRDVARLEDDLVRTQEGPSLRVEELEDLRRLGLRLQALIEAFEPLA